MIVIDMMEKGWSESVQFEAGYPVGQLGHYQLNLEQRCKDISSSRRMNMISGTKLQLQYCRGLHHHCFNYLLLKSHVFFLKKTVLPKCIPKQNCYTLQSHFGSTSQLVCTYTLKFAPLCILEWSRLIFWRVIDFKGNQLISYFITLILSEYLK